MSKVLTVIRKEYLERVRSKAFLIGTLIGPALMGLLVLGPTLLAEVAEDQDRAPWAWWMRPGGGRRPGRDLLDRGDDHVPAVLTCDGRGLRRGAQDAGADRGGRRRPGDPADFFEAPRGRPSTTPRWGRRCCAAETLAPALNRVLREERFRREGVAAARTYLLARAEWSSLMLTERPRRVQNAEVGIVGGIVMVMIIYFMVLVYGQQNLTVVIEEKSSRMVEVLLASLRPSS